ncbi:uncharacterized protein N7511_003582 [Penicillium nucicola]|uniref:uncharacterized protein n=1 Tax=Penicillium nucicola TaxID=1850975 RepID=UPI0025453633|nr:uncharacterized protein N7511_003582 [Penicillium nucicola]KAJ5765966.1 hypothetical protein N7511_003582 [Penicillium nucicola]
MSCPTGSDDILGPRVSVLCRPFDFTLLFEDAFFKVLPASLFLLVTATRLCVLVRAPVKVTSHRLATCKLIVLGLLLLFHLLYLAFRIQNPFLYTSLSLASSILDVVVIMASLLLSWLEDQRSIRPSDLMIIYFAVMTILSLARARSLWLLTVPTSRPAALWTLICAGTAAVLGMESVHKTQRLGMAYHQPSKEVTASFWVRSFFIWVIPLFRTGFSTILAVHDMPNVDTALTGAEAERKIIIAWARVNPESKHRLLRAACRAYFLPLVSAIIPRLCLSAFKFCQPFLISATLNFMSSQSTPENQIYGPALVGAYVLTYLGMAISNAVYWRQAFRLNTMLRAGLIPLIYRQTTKLHAADFKDNPAITLMGTDVERIITTLHALHEAWAAPLEVGVGIFLLERQLGVACLIPAVISLVTVIASVPISQKSNAAISRWIERVQARLGVTSSMLQDMKSVKMLGLTEKLFECVSQLRRVELQVSERFRKLLVVQVILSYIPLTLAPFATFSIFTIISAVKNSDALLSTRVFTSLSLISLTTAPLLVFVQLLPSLYQSIACFDRIEMYCTKVTLDVLEEQFSTNSIELSQALSAPSSTSHDPVMEFTKASFSWSQETTTVLHNLNFAIKRKKITAIIGPLGSGKTTLLESTLGETVLTDGSMSHFLSNVAYCPQIAWIVNDTIRQNIIGPLAFDLKWYQFVIWACALENDLEDIPEGDLSKAGSSGVTLSGGQKQRISLARALYSRAPVLVLDDVFSGLDNKSITTITSRLFTSDGHFKDSGKTVILATHNHRVLPYTDEIIILDEGKVTEITTYDCIRHYLPQESDTESNEVLPDDEIRNEREPRTRISASSSQPRDEEETDQDISRRDGKWSVYAYYLKSAGWKMIVILAASVVLFGFSDKFTTIWLQSWSDANEQRPNQRLGFYLGIYAALFGISFLSLITACWALFVRVINNTGLMMHAHLLRSTMKYITSWNCAQTVFNADISSSAPFSFFQKVDAGLTTNRFSQDIELIDMSLPIQAINTYLGFSNCCVQLVILGIMGKYLTITVPALAVILYFVQSYYLRTSRQVRLLDIEAKSPLFTHFVETIQGMAVIRAMGWKVPFQERLEDALNQSQKPFYMLFCIQQWLQLVLDCVVMALAVILVSLVVSLKDQFSSGSIGVALNLILSFNTDLMMLIRSWTVLETSIGAVSRVLSFVNDTPSEYQLEGTTESPTRWPSHGEVIFDNVVAKYSSDAPSILNGVCLSIKPGEKIAICGSSGSGKTSLILGLLKMIELQSGTVSIDGVNLSPLQCHEVRSHVNVIPQDPFFMPGTLRVILDCGTASVILPDECLIEALETVGLWKKIVSVDRGLDQPLSVSDWSMGERQLLALARALVKKSSILVLDEATSSVDWETESTIQTIIEREFASQTVIAVVHRLRFIDRFDRVGLMKQGSLIECDRPQTLLSTRSEFRAFYHTRQSE